MPLTGTTEMISLSACAFVVAIAHLLFELRRGLWLASRWRVTNSCELFLHSGTGGGTTSRRSRQDTRRWAHNHMSLSAFALIWLLSGAMWYSVTAWTGTV